VRIKILESQIPPEVQAEESIRFTALVQTGTLTPEDLRVELYSGPLNADGDIMNPIITEMKPVSQEKDGYLYEVMLVPCCGSGRHGYTARVLPRHPDPKHPFASGLITWVS
jgi:starch phosphorylase